jgi:hypothetical protein
VDAARVEMAPATRVLGATSVGLERALASARGKIDACYRSALPKLVGAVDGAAVLHLETDDVGVVRRASLEGAHSAALGGCVSKATIGSRVPHVDTGTVSADVPLIYRPR